MIKRTRRFPLVFAVLSAGVLSMAASVESEPHEYKMGERAAGDIVAPVTIRVVNPDLSAALKQASAAQVPLIFRQIDTAAVEAEADLRASIDTARTLFLVKLRQTSATGQSPLARAADSPAYVNAIHAATAAGPKDFPIDRLAPLWARGIADAAIVDALLQPLREVMAQPIANDSEANSLPMDQPIRLIRVKSLLEEPSLPYLKNAGVNTTAAHLSGLESARDVVESYFPADQKALAQFSAAFLRANTFAAPGLTELLRSVRKDDVIAYDTYAAGQIVVKKGQMIDGKALAVLAALRDKKQIEALVAKVELKQPVAGPSITDTEKFIISVGGMGLVMLVLLWRWGGPRFSAESSTPAQTVSEPPALLTNTDAENWRTRALIAEQRAEQAHEVIRQGALGWMRERLFRSIFRQRADLLSTQQMAEAEMIELEQRMAKLLVPLQERIKTYEGRIRELEETLASQEGDNRHLIDARISRARHQLELERARAGQEF